MSEMVVYSKAEFAAHVAYLTRNCAGWAGDLIGDADIHAGIDPDTVNRFTVQVRERLKHFDQRADLQRAALSETTT